MFNIVEPYSGHFFDAEWLEYDKTNKTFKVAKKIKLKGQSSIGVSSGIKETILVQEVAGRPTNKETFKINVVHNYDFKPYDKIRDLTTDITDIT